MDVSNQLHASAALHLGKWLQIHTALEAGWDPERVNVLGRKVCGLSGIKQRFFGCAATTDYDIPALIKTVQCLVKKKHS